MNLTCTHCNHQFATSKKQTEFIETSQQKKMTFIMISCPSCSSDFSINPMHPEVMSQDEVNIDHPLRCPRLTCSGWAVYVDDEPPFWGCGECGFVWSDQSDLYKEIAEVSKKYGYRKKVYQKSGDEYMPVSLEDEPENYEALVEMEWKS